MHQFALAYALSTVSGLRVSYPVAALAIGAHLRVIHLPPSLAWLGSDIAFPIVIGVCVIEAIAHKFRQLDHWVHLLHRVLSPLVGAVAAFAVCPSHDASALFPGLLGGANAFIVHNLRSTARITGGMFIFGSLHPLASLAEDGSLVTGIATAFSSPQTTAEAMLLVVACWWFFTYRPVPRRRRRARA